MDRPDDAPRPAGPRPFSGYQPAPLGAPPARREPPRTAEVPPRRRPQRSWERPINPALRRGLTFALVLHLILGGLVTVRWHRGGGAPAGTPGNFHIDVSPEIQAKRAQVIPPVERAPEEPQNPKAEPVIEKPNAKGPIEPRAVIPQTRRPSSQGALLAPGARSAQHGALTAPTSFQLGTGGAGGNSEFAYYLAGVRAKIERAWSPPRGAAGRRALTAKVAFTIGRRGDVSAITLEERSGIGFFDQSCQDAIRRAAPFAPLPDGYGYDDMLIHFTFSYAD